MPEQSEHLVKSFDQDLKRLTDMLIRMGGIVENQVALGDAFAARAVLLRLMAEGLDRHEAIHAIGSVLSEQRSGALRRSQCAVSRETQSPDRLLSGDTGALRF